MSSSLIGSTRRRLRTDIRRGAGYQPARRLPVCPTRRKRVEQMLHGKDLDVIGAGK
jgi:hypothetical protein